MLTIYFDTSFFIDLRDADDEVASSTLSELNALKVRHVLSNVLFRELLFSGAPRSERVRLVERVSRFKEGPLVIGPGDWAALLCEDDDRRAVGEALRQIDACADKTKSLAVFTRSRPTVDQVEELLDAKRSLLLEIG